MQVGNYGDIEVQNGEILATFDYKAGFGDVKLVLTLQAASLLQGLVSQVSNPGEKAFLMAIISMIGSSPASSTTGTQL